MACHVAAVLAAACQAVGDRLTRVVANPLSRSWRGRTRNLCARCLLLKVKTLGAASPYLISSYPAHSISKQHVLIS